MVSRCFMESVRPPSAEVTAESAVDWEEVSCGPSAAAWRYSVRSLGTWDTDGGEGGSPPESQASRVTQAVAKQGRIGKRMGPNPPLRREVGC